MARSTLWPIVKLSLSPQSSISMIFSWRTAKPGNLCIKVNMAKNDVVFWLVGSPPHTFRTPRLAQGNSPGAMAIASPHTRGRHPPALGT